MGRHRAAGVLAGLCVLACGCGRLGYELTEADPGADASGIDAGHASDGAAPGSDATPGLDAATDAGGSGTDGGRTDGGTAVHGGPCGQLLAGDPGAADGSHVFDPDGEGGLPPMDVQCDMTTDGGGWTLVLNYVHLGGTTPETRVLTDRLPQLGSSTLGTDESGAESWGHAAPALLARFDVSELRFYCATSAHERVLHFVTEDAACVDYVQTGTGGCYELVRSWRPLADHTANLPAAATHLYSGQGAQALTYLPFFKPSSAKLEWLIIPAEWECDDSVGAAADTIHRVWVR